MVDNKTTATTVPPGQTAATMVPSGQTPTPTVPPSQTTGGGGGSSSPPPPPPPPPPNLTYHESLYKETLGYEYNLLTQKTTNDFQIYHLTLMFLGGTAILVILLSFGMLFMGKETSEGLIAIASAAIGAIAGLLAPSTIQKSIQDTRGPKG